MTDVKKPIGFVVPTRWEAGPILKAFGFQKIKTNFYRARIGDQTIVLALSGVGAEPARAASYALVAMGVGELVSVGFCGALIPGLAVGSLVTTRLTSSLKPVVTVAEREALSKRASAVAVDMETQAIVEAGTRRGVPIRVLRVVSDQMQDDLTPLFGSDGAFSLWRMAFRLLSPAAWPLALRLGRQSRLAAAKLVDAIPSFLAAQY